MSCLLLLIMTLVVENNFSVLVLAFKKSESLLYRRDLHMENWSKPCLSGTEYEERIVYLLSEYGFTTNRTGNDDKGVDIIAEIDLNNKHYKYYIQCKFWNTTLGLSPIQKVFTGTSLRGNDGSPVVMINNNVTVEARNVAKRLGVEIIARPEWNDIASIIEAGEIPRHYKTYTGLFGIMVGKELEEPDIITKALDKNSLVLSETDTIDQLLDSVNHDFSKAIEYTREAARLQQQAADCAEKALSLQREALIRNLEYA